MNNNKILIVGLGNEGYDNTVHNGGADFVKRQIKDLGMVKNNQYYYSLLIPNILFAFNVSNVNTSGIVVKDILRRNNIKNLIVLYDDIRVKYGCYKVVFGGPHTGHNGIKSIVEHCCKLLQDSDFYRVRIGVGPKPLEIELRDYVLSKIYPQESDLMWSTYGKLWYDVFEICKNIEYL